MDRLRQVNNKAMKLIEIISVIMLSSIAIMIGLQVLSRVLGIGLQWPEEMSRFAFVAVTFSGSVLAVARNKHIVVDMLLLKLSERKRNCLEIFTNICVVIFCGFAIKGIILTIKSAVGVHANSLLWFKYNYLYYFVFACIVLIGIEAVLNVLFLASDLKKESEK